MTRKSLPAIMLLIVLAGVGSCWAQDTPADREGAQAEPQPTADAQEEATLFAVWWAKIVEAGWPMLPLGFLSVLGVAFTLERLFGLRRGVIVPDGLAERADALWKQGKFAELEKAAVASNSTLGRILAFVVEHRTAPAADISMLAGDVAARDLRRHQSRAYALAVVGTLSPLLGLMGTVYGMIMAFDVIATAGEMGDVTLLGSSISVALLTTLAGLIIAIPALFFYHLFKSRTNSLFVDLEEEATDLISNWTLKQTPAAEPTPAPAGKEA